MSGAATLAEMVKLKPFELTYDNTDFTKAMFQREKIESAYERNIEAIKAVFQREKIESATLREYIPAPAWPQWSPYGPRERVEPARDLVVRECKLNRQTNTLRYVDGNYQEHEVSVLILKNPVFVETTCGGQRGGYVTGVIEQDVVGFLRKGAPVQKGRYSKSYGWNVQRASRCIIEGSKILFD